MDLMTLLQRINTSSETKYQVIRFSLIGGIAAAIHMIFCAIFVEKAEFHPILANIFSFFIAFIFSFCGHHYWTYLNNNTSIIPALSKFFIVATTSFILNNVLFILFHISFGMHYFLALFIVLSLVPTLTFILSKVWAFKET